MLSSALLSLGVAGSALAWPSIGHSRHSSIARAVHARQEPVVKAKEPVAATWFASWHADEFSLANVSWNKYTTVSYSFALTTPNVSFVNISDPEVFKDFVSTAHANNVSATISIGGWTGSLYFSSAVATAENRTEFVKTMVSLLEDNNLDGLSFDWEYPNAAGIGCNTKSPNDTENFLLFLKELRTALPSNATLSAATAITPFISADGTPSTNVSEFASVFDYIQIMNYDIWGSWSGTTGPNAPLNDTCATNATQKVGSAVSAVEAWTKAGFPADQLVLGVVGYGHGFSVAPENALTDGTLNAYSPFNKSFTPPGDAWDDAPANGTVDVCGNPQAQGGNWNFWGLIEGGFLNENGTANTAEGIVYKYDECSQTPFVYNQTSGVFVAFDNAASFAAKGQFINATGLRGFAMWEAGGDYDDILLDAIRSAAGFPEVADDDYDDCEDGETGTTTPETGNSSNNSGNTSGNTSNNSGNTSGNTSSNNSGNTSNNNSGSKNSGSKNSGSNSSNNSGSTTSSNTSNTPSNSGSTSTTTTTNNSGSSNSNNSGSNNSNSGSSNTTPDNDDDDDCEDDDEYPETTAATPTSSAKPTATASSEDDEECEDDEYPEPAVTSTVKPTTAKPTTYQAPTATPATPSTSTAQPVTTPETTVSDADADECEDDEIIDATTSAASSGTASPAIAATSTSASASTVVSVTSAGTASVVSTSTASTTLSGATVTSTISASSSASESAPTVSTTATESASSAKPTTTQSAVSASTEPSSASATIEATSSVPTSSHAAPTSSRPVTSAHQTSSFESSSSYKPTSAEPSTTSTHSTHPAPSQTPAAPTSEPVTTSAAPTTTSSSSTAPTVSALNPMFR